jgi:hypothetical protein
MLRWLFEQAIHRLTAHIERKSFLPLIVALILAAIASFIAWWLGAAEDGLIFGLGIATLLFAGLTVPFIIPLPKIAAQKQDSSNEIGSILHHWVCAGVLTVVSEKQIITHNGHLDQVGRLLGSLNEGKWPASLALSRMPIASLAAIRYLRAAGLVHFTAESGRKLHTMIPAADLPTKLIPAIAALKGQPATEEADPGKNPLGAYITVSAFLCISLALGILGWIKFQDRDARFACFAWAAITGVLGIMCAVGFFQVRKRQRARGVIIRFAS